NIPHEKEFEDGVFVSIRNLFAASPNKKVIFADFSQQEFKVMALLSGDKRLIKAIFEDREDFHTLVARALYPKYRETEVLFRDAKEKLSGRRFSLLHDDAWADLEARSRSYEIFLKTARTKAKNFNFGRNYLATLPTLAATLGVTE